MKSSYKSQLLLFVIVVFAFGLRIVAISNVPPGLNRDEASLGYTAYSILKTGRDEYGVLFPLSLKSFGDWKLPVYAYVAIPFISIFGLTETAVRFPSALFGTLTVLLTYLLVKKLIDRLDVALLAAAILAISPWHIFFSRVSSEANLAVCMISLGLWLLLVKSTQKFLQILGVFIISLTLLTYHGNHVFTPLFFGATIWYIRKDFSRGTQWILVGVFVLISLFVFGVTLRTADSTKLSGLLIINDISLIHVNIDKNRQIFTQKTLGKLLNNKAVFLAEQVAFNYIRTFSPEFLAIQGGTNLQHNIPDFGNLYLIELPFLLLGLFYLFLHKEKSARFLLWWILISPLGASLTKDAPHSARSVSMLPAIQIVIAYGMVNSLQIFHRLWQRRIFISVLILVYAVSFSIFLGRYFVTFPFKRFSSWGFPYKEMSEKLARLKNNYVKVIVSRPDYSPYIYYAFYNKSAPQNVQQQLIRYPATVEGFEHVREFDGIAYEKLNWTDELLIPNRLYVDWAESVPSGATQSAILITPDEIMKLATHGELAKSVEIGDIVTSRIVDTIRLPDSSPLLYFIETRISTSAAKRY